MSIPLRRQLYADPHGLVRRVGGLLGLDEGRLLWLFARCVQVSPDCFGLVEVARVVAPRG